MAVENNDGPRTELDASDSTVSEVVTSDRLCDAMGGDIEAQIQLARSYRYGIGVEKNQIQALDWYRRAAENGSLASQLVLARAFRDGDYVEQSSDEAFKWFHRAARQGHIEAQLEVSKMYLTGYGVEPSEVLSKKWLRVAETEEKLIRRIGSAIQISSNPPLQNDLAD